MDYFSGIYGFYSLNLYRILTWARNAPLKAFSRKQQKNIYSLKLKKIENTNRRGFVVLSCFISYSFYNYLVISTVTYSVEIYTPNTKVNDIFKVAVQITGEDYIQTQRRTLFNLGTTPQTEVQGYVKYQTLETVCYHIGSHLEES